jgi:hypothetical protein
VFLVAQDRHQCEKEKKEMKKDKHRVSSKGSGKKTRAFAAPSELKLEQKGSKLTRLDYIAAPVIACIAAIWVFSYIGTSIEWDDLYYMNLSQHTTPQVWVLNRYGHIYLQKLFFWLVGDALTGAKVYWCFLFFSTGVLIYWCARILAGKGSYIIGVIAALFFYSQQLIFYYAGCTFSGFTVMFLITLAIFVYLYFLIDGCKHRHLVIAILGFIFFWATKSKEPGISIAILFFGLGVEETGARSVRQFVRDIGWVCLGMLVGCMLLMTLDLAFMGDAFFSVRPSHIKAVFRTNINLPGRPNPVPIRSWYTALPGERLLAPLFAPFFIYLLIGYKAPGRRFSYREKVVWLLPVGLIFFMSFIRHWHIIHRYIVPAMPGICIWAAQFFRFKFIGRLRLGKNHHGIPRLPVALVLILLAFIIVSIFMSKVPVIVKLYHLKGPDVFYMVGPLVFGTTVLLMVAALSRRRGLVALFLSALSFFSIVYFPLSNNLALLKRRITTPEGKELKRSEWRYEPFRIFADEIRFDEDVKILISKDVHKRFWMLGRDARSHCWMFNVFFNQKCDCGQVLAFTRESGQFIDGTWEDILKGNYTYAFLTWQDWNGIRGKHNVDHLLRDYTLKADKATQLILLKRH